MCVRRSPGRRQSRSAVKAGWVLWCCRPSSASVRTPSAALYDPVRYSASGTPGNKPTDRLKHIFVVCRHSNCHSVNKDNMPNDYLFILKEITSVILSFLTYLRSWCFQTVGVQSSPPVSWRTASSEDRGSNKTASCHTYRGATGWFLTKGLKYCLKKNI